MISFEQEVTDHWKNEMALHINLPQDVASFACSLPRMPSQLDAVVVCREVAPRSHKYFKVRQSRVLQVLQWLMENNGFFCGISLDHDALAQLV